jgi:hypothetical protein
VTKVRSGIPFQLRVAHKVKIVIARVPNDKVGREDEAICLLCKSETEIASPDFIGIAMT